MGRVNFYRLAVAVSLAFTGLSLVALAGTDETGFLNRSVTVGKTEYKYQVFVPRDFTRREKWPVIMALHGGGEYGSDGYRQMLVGLAPAIRRNPDRFRAIVVFPQAVADGKPGWQLESGTAAMAALDKTLKQFNGDPNRVILTGYSAGGNGTWFLASRYPERFAALVVVCGFVSKFTSPSNRIEYPSLVSDPDPHTEVAKRVSRIPIRMYHGDVDDIVLPVESRKMAAALKTLGANYEYFELPKTNHNAWDPAYNDAKLIEWMLKQRRLR